MLVVISNPTAIADEAALINNLFDAGLEVLHVRKSGVVAEEIIELLEKIKPRYHNRIALHQCHELADDFGIKRLHYTATHREERTTEALIKRKQEDYIMSTSIHSVEEYNELPDLFDYCFFGPVFNSISKPGYASVVTDNYIFPVRENKPKVVGIGGINTTNIFKLKEMQFSGAAVLGSIWQKPGESILQFKTLQQAWKETDR